MLYRVTLVLIGVVTFTSAGVYWTSANNLACWFGVIGLAALGAASSPEL